MEDKFESLRAMRRAKGLCFKCGDKYAPGHKCATQISLHVLEELLDALQLETKSDDEQSGTSDRETEQDTEVMSISEDEVNGIAKRRTIKLQGLIQKQSVLILVDSGSSHNFISKKLVTALNLFEDTVPTATVRLADGTPIQSDTAIHNLQWWTQGHTFCNTMRVLPLGSYDIILGMDWLADCSPMFVD